MAGNAPQYGMSGNGLAILMVSVLAVDHDALVVRRRTCRDPRTCRRRGSSRCCRPRPRGTSSRSKDRLMPKAMSSGVTSWPFSYLTPSRIVNVHSVKSSFGRAEVGGEVRDQDHVAGLLVVDVLRQRPGDEAAQDRAGVDVVGLGRVHGVQTGDADDLDRAALLGAFDLGSRGLAVGVLARPGAPASPESTVLSHRLDRRRRRRAATCGEREQRDGGDGNNRFLQPHFLTHPFLGWLCVSRGRRAVSDESWGRRRLGSSRLGG